VTPRAGSILTPGAKFIIQPNKNSHATLDKNIYNKRTQRALGRSPEEKVTLEPIIENPRGTI